MTDVWRETGLEPPLPPWWEDALRKYAAARGPSGDAWNISAILDLLRRESSMTPGDELGLTETQPDPFKRRAA